MSYQVIARKWRPQTFDEVVGQDVVTRTLQNAIRSERIAHAFLFSGVRGVGKTTVARILAKALNCQSGPSPEPCGECVSCQEIKEGNSLDVQEIDAASNRGIDSIRELRESVRYRAARDRFKIFIVDEVHMLTNEAFNALLKTLEEPPEHVKFILATTEHQKIPVTITSRCQQYEFRPIPFSLILERLRLITTTEEISISDDALRSLASIAQGSMRDAQSALDQIIAFSGKEIVDEDVRALLGIVDVELVSALVQRIVDQDREGVLRAMQDLRTSGISARNFCSTLLSYVRSLMVTRVVGWDESMIQLSESLREAVEKQSKSFSELDLIRFYDTLNTTNNELRWHSHPSIHLEITLLKLIELAKLPTIEAVVSRLEDGEQFVKKSCTPKPKPNPAAEKKTFWNTPGQEVDNISAELESAVEPNAVQLEDTEPKARLMTALQNGAMGLYQHLQMAFSVQFEEGNLAIRFPASERFHAQQVQESENRSILSRTAAEVAGKKVTIEVELEGEPEVTEKQDPMEDPKVKSFLDRFPGKVIVNRESGD